MLRVLPGLRQFRGYRREYLRGFPVSCSGSRTAIAVAAGARDVLAAFPAAAPARRPP